LALASGKDFHHFTRLIRSQHQQAALPQIAGCVISQRDERQPENVATECERLLLVMSGVEQANCCKSERRIAPDTAVCDDAAMRTRGRTVHKPSLGKRALLVALSLGLVLRAEILKGGII